MYLVILGLARARIPINVINLDKDVLRWESVTAELRAKGEDMDVVKRLRVYGKELSPEELRVSTSRAARLFCTPGMIGCYLSHRSFGRRRWKSHPWR